MGTDRVGLGASASGSLNSLPSVNSQILQTSRCKTLKLCTILMSYSPYHLTGRNALQQFSQRMTKLLHVCSQTFGNDHGCLRPKLYSSLCYISPKLSSTALV